MPRRGGHKARNMSVQDERQMRSRGKMLRATAHHYTPPRDTFDEIANILWEGYESDRLKREILADAELLQSRDRANYHGNGPALKSLPNDFTLFREHVIGEVIQSGNIVDLAWSKVANKPNLSNLGGRVNANNDIDWGEGRPVPAGKVAAGYDYKDLKNTPALGKYLTKNDVKKSALR